MAHYCVKRGDSEPETGIKTMKWEDLVPPPIDDTDIYDFAPFLDAPAVKAKSGPDTQVNLLNIPKSKIPSPLADNLSPRTVKDIKDCLVGPDGKSDSRGNGREIWLSWKRAWDIWNNHYIEGRENPVWIREEWERREKAKRDWDAERDDRRRVRDRKRAEATGGLLPFDTAHNPLLPAGQLPRTRPPHQRMPTIPTDLRSESAVSGCATAETDEEVKNTGSAPTAVPLPKKALKAGQSPPITDHPVETEDDNDINMLDFEDDCLVETIIDDRESDSDSSPPPEKIPRDGSSGGYKPLKKIEEYEEPDEEFGKVWVDAVTNTVWAPRRLGEKTLKIELDNDIEDFSKKTELMVDGGVDCSRSPFPVSSSD